MLSGLTEAEAAALEWDWDFWARPSQLPPEGDWFLWFIQAGRGFGKMLGLDTLIPTPNGWARLGSMVAGDWLFDERGVPCRIEAVYDGVASEAWRLGFSDGTALDACADHLWLTDDWRSRKAKNRAAKPVVQAVIRTTREIVQTLRYGKRGDLNHSIPLAEPLQMPERILPIDPYVLGIWLGDGSAAGAEVTTADELVVAGIAGTGHPVKRYATPPEKTPRYGVGALHGPLRSLNLLKNKHIPPVYLRASAQQRRSLLQGLMDSDGYASKSHVEFCSTSRALADGVMELARSLGEKPRLYTGRATLQGKDCGPKYRVSFRPIGHVFRLPRKLQALRRLGAQQSRNRQRMIVSATTIPAQPMRCLTVSSPSGLFLAGEGMIPTHNTRMCAEYVRRMVETGQWRRIALVNDTERDTRQVMVEGPSGLLAVCPPWNKPVYNPSRAQVVWPNGAIAYMYAAESPDMLRGPEHDGGWCFTAGTLIATPEGERKIEELRAGDRVLTRYGERSVRSVMSRLASVGRVTFSNGVELTGTAEHPVLVKVAVAELTYGWTNLAALHEGDEVVAAFAPAVETFAVSVVSTWEAAGEATVYNLSVDGVHEYVANGIVVHNCDEPAKWKNLRRPDSQGSTAWTNLLFGIRTGPCPRIVAGTTPVPSKWIKERQSEPTTVITRGSSYENRANLAIGYFSTVIAPYEGTRLGRQEIMGELLDDVPGALWQRQLLDNTRVKTAPPLRRVVIGIDPAVTSGEDADETGIVAAGLGEDGHVYILADGSGHYTPSVWAQRAIMLYSSLKADRVIGEANNGGDLIEATLRSVTGGRVVPYKKVHASRGKYVRAEPVASLWEQGRAHLVGSFDALEDQMCQFLPENTASPDRADAMVWAVTELIGSYYGAAPRYPVRPIRARVAGE